MIDNGDIMHSSDNHNASVLLYLWHTMADEEI